MENLTICPQCKGEKVIITKNKVGNDQVIDCPTCAGSGILATSKEVNNNTVFNLESFNFKKSHW